MYANRGLAGIDGTISTAIGIAVATGLPSHALIGDLTFLHDLTGLVIGPDEPRPDLRVVVANDDGRFSNVGVTIPSSFSFAAPQQFSVVATGEQSAKSAQAPFQLTG